MAYIFMDESGCLGFDFKKSKTSKYFVVAFLLSNNKKSLERVVSKTFRSMSAQHWIKHCGTLHSSKELPRTRIKLLSLLREQNNASIMIIRFNKRVFYALLKDKVAVLYNYIVNILLDRLITQKLLPIDEPIYVVKWDRVNTLAFRRTL